MRNAGCEPKRKSLAKSAQSTCKRRLACVILSGPRRPRGDPAPPHPHKPWKPSCLSAASYNLSLLSTTNAHIYNTRSIIPPPPKKKKFTTDRTCALLHHGRCIRVLSLERVLHIEPMARLGPLGIRVVYGNRLSPVCCNVAVSRPPQNKNWSEFENGF